MEWDVHIHLPTQIPSLIHALLGTREEVSLLIKRKKKERKKAYESVQSRSSPNFSF